jgi:coniferyl-aldehyde dehydrogenase
MKPQRRAWTAQLPGARNRVIPQPLGVVGVIVPWNFPLNLSLVPLSYIFAAGNRAMVKMSENSRRLAALLIEKMPAYFPPEKLQFFDETGGVGVAFSQLPFDHLLFTGSRHHRPRGDGCRGAQPVPGDAGARRQVAGHRLPTTSRSTAAERILFVKCLNAGQICTTVDHAWLPQGKLEAFVRLAQAMVPRVTRRWRRSDYTSIIDVRSFERLLARWTKPASGRTVVPLLPGPAFDAARARSRRTWCWTRRPTAI